MCQSNIMLAMDISISMINDDELDRILENTNLDEFELTDLPREQLDGSSQEELGIGLVPTMDTNSTPGLAPQKWNNTELHLGVYPCQGSSQSSRLINAHQSNYMWGLLEGGVYFIQLLV